MKKILFLIFFCGIFLLVSPDYYVEAKTETAVCEYTYLNNLQKDGSTTVADAYKNETITITIYDDGSHDGSSSSWLDLGGDEKLNNWGQDSNGASDIKSQSCPAYVSVNKESGNAVWYGFNENTFRSEGTVIADRNPDDMTLVFKWTNATSPTYTCEYKSVGYQIIVDTMTETLSISALSSTTLGVYYFAGSTLRDNWFDPVRGTEKCLATVACRSDKSSNYFYIFNDVYEAQMAGYPYCEQKACSGDDCDENVETSCLSYTKKKDEIEKLYEKIANGDGDKSQLYAEVHEKEVYLSTICNSLFSTYDYSNTCVQACMNWNSDLAKIKTDHGIADSGHTANACNLSERLVAWIVRIISIVRYIVPALLIVLSVLDFIKAIASDKDDEVKKAGTRFVKRLIVSAVLLILPIVIEFALGLFNIPVNDFCL